MSGTQATGALRDQQRAFTRERIVASAEELFTRQGYLETTVDDIVKAVGCSRATFYLHFRAQPDLVEEIGRRLTPQVEQFYVELDTIPHRPDAPEMRRWVRDAYEWMAEKHALLKAMELAGQQGLGSWEGSMTLADRMPRYLRRWPEKSRDLARLRVALLSTQLAALYNFFEQHPEPRRPEIDDQIIDSLVVLWSAALEPTG